MRTSEGKTGFWEVKEEVRVLGIDDGPFKFGQGETALLVGTVFRGGLCLEGIVTTRVDVDGDDSTDQIIRMISRSRHRGQVRVVMTDGLTFGGFNVMDAPRIHLETGLPLISVTRSEPDLEAIGRALARFPDAPKRWQRVQEAGAPMVHVYAGSKRRGRVYFQAFGIGEEDAHAILEITSTRSLMPEPIRVAHIIASGVVRGESYGRV